MSLIIRAPGSNELQWTTNSTPSQVTKLPYAETARVQGYFGAADFQHYTRNGFHIWYSRYAIHQPTQLVGELDAPVLELHTQFGAAFVNQWDSFEKTLLRPRQYNLTFTPFVANKADFDGGKTYETFDVHFSLEYLQGFAPDYPVLDRFLAKVCKGVAATLIPGEAFVTPKMTAVMHDMLGATYAPATMARFYESRVADLLIYGLDHAQGLKPAGIKLSGYEYDRLHDAAQILLAHLDTWITIPELAQKVGLNRKKLKAGFKQVHGTTIFDYVQRAKMEQAYRYLVDTNMSVSEIATYLGYNDATNLNKPFKAYFGCTPGYVQKHKQASIVHKSGANSREKRDKTS